MAKGKSSNPMDAARKAARKRELKRNKEERAKVREVATVKKDTRPLEAEIRRLESRGGGGGKGGPALTQGEREELDELKAEVKKIKEAKEAYVKEHPEHRKFVFAREIEEQADEDRKKKEQQAQQQQQQLGGQGFGQSRRPWEGRDPRWSVDYDPVFNPLGAPPPGMPYREKTKEQFEAQYGVEEELDHSDVGDDEDNEEDDDDDDDSEDDDIVMPEGPPPLPTEDVEGDSDADSDGIVMPEGPPPAPPPSGPRAVTVQPPLPPGPPPPPTHFHLQGPALAYGRPFRPTHIPPHHARPPLPPMGLGNHTSSPYPHGGPPFHALPLFNGGPPPFLPGYGNLPPRPSPSFPRPPPPNQARPPVSAPTAPGPPPARPPITISKAPQLRDLKKEATTFVPPALRRKQAAERARAKAGGLTRINAAPLNDEEGDGALDTSASAAAVAEEAGRGTSAMPEKKLGLMDALRPHLSAGAPGSARGEKSGAVDRSQDDYQKFLGDINDLL